jgi:hypothetical protein
VRGSDDISESLEAQALAGIWLVLAKARVPVAPNSPEGNAMSEEQMLRIGLPEFEKLVELLRTNAKNAGDGDRN